MAGPERRRAGEALLPYLAVSPALLMIVFLALVPLSYGLWLSFSRWDLLSGRPPAFGTLSNYARLLGDAGFWAAFVRTLWWTLGTVAFQIVAGMAFALLLNRKTPVAERVSSLILLPWTIPFVVVAYAWVFLLESPGGPLQHTLHALGLSRFSPLGESGAALPTITLISGWKGMPFMAIALLAALKSIPGDLFEAARADGASPAQTFAFVTLPLLRNTLVVIGLILGILAFYSFDLAWITTKGGPGEATMLVGIRIYLAFFNNVQPTYAAAMSTTMLLVLVAMSLLVLRLRRAA